MNLKMYLIEMTFGSEKHFAVVNKPSELDLDENQVKLIVDFYRQKAAIALPLVEVSSMVVPFLILHDPKEDLAKIEVKTLN